MDNDEDCIVISSGNSGDENQSLRDAGAAAVAAADGSVAASCPTSSSCPTSPSPEALQQLLDMGFDEELASRALRLCDSNLGHAVHYILIASGPLEEDASAEDTWGGVEPKLEPKVELSRVNDIAELCTQVIASIDELSNAQGRGFGDRNDGQDHTVISMCQQSDMAKVESIQPELGTGFCPDHRGRRRRFRDRGADGGSSSSEEDLWTPRPKKLRFSRRSSSQSQNGSSCGQDASRRSSTVSHYLSYSPSASVDNLRWYEEISSAKMTRSHKHQLESLCGGDPSTSLKIEKRPLEIWDRGIFDPELSDDDLPDLDLDAVEDKVPCDTTHGLNSRLTELGLFDKRATVCVRKLDIAHARTVTQDLKLHMSPSTAQLLSDTSCSSSDCVCQDTADHVGGDSGPQPSTSSTPSKLLLGDAERSTIRSIAIRLKLKTLPQVDFSKIHLTSRTSQSPSVVSISSQSSRPESQLHCRQRHFTDIFTQSTSPCSRSASVSESPVVTDDCMSEQTADEVIVCDGEIETCGDSDSNIEISKPHKIASGRRTVSCSTRNPNVSFSQHSPVGASVQANEEGVEYRLVKDYCHPVYLEALQSPPVHAHISMVSTTHVSCGCPTATPRRVSKFYHSQVNMVQSCVEEGEVSKNEVVLKLVENFLTAHSEPPNEILQVCLQFLAESKTQLGILHAYNLLKRIQCIHPPCGVPFTWLDIEAAVKNLDLLLGIHNVQEPLKFLSSALSIQFMVSYLEDELLHRTLTSKRQILRSTAYRWLSADTSFKNVSQVIHWVAIAVYLNEYPEAVHSFIPLQAVGGGQKCPEAAAVSPKEISAASRRKLQSPRPPLIGIKTLPKILPLLQRLLCLSLAVSRCPENCAKRIAVEITREYVRMPNLSHRRLMLNTITSPLVRMKVCQHVLEEYCSNNNFGCGNMNVTLEDLILTYFSYEPPMNCNTPPPTPSDHEDEVDDQAPQQARAPMPKLYAAESVEELAMLLSVVLQSYLYVARGKLHQPLSTRLLGKMQLETAVQTGLGAPLSNLDTQTLENIDTHRRNLESWLASLTTELSPRTHLYLGQISCLGDLS